MELLKLLLQTLYIQFLWHLALHPDREQIYLAVFYKPFLYRTFDSQQSLTRANPKFNCAKHECYKATCLFLSVHFQKSCLLYL